MATLMNIKVAILADNGFEQEERVEPRRVLQENGAETTLISPSEDTITAWDHTEWGQSFDVERTVNDADPHDYDMLLLPGGVMNPDNMRRNEAVQAFIQLN